MQHLVPFLGLLKTFRNWPLTFANSLERYRSLARIRGLPIEMADEAKRRRHSSSVATNFSEFQKYFTRAKHFYSLESLTRARARAKRRGCAQEWKDTASLAFLLLASRRSGGWMALSLFPPQPPFFSSRVFFFPARAHTAERGARRKEEAASSRARKKKKKSQARLVSASVSEHAKERCEKRSLAPRESRTGSRSFLRQTLRAYLIVLFVNATHRRA